MIHVISEDLPNSLKYFYLGFLGLVAFENPFALSCETAYSLVLGIRLKAVLSDYFFTSSSAFKLIVL